MEHEPTENSINAEIAWVTYINPFTIIRKDSEPDFGLSLDDINSNSYNHGKLCEIVAAVPWSEIDPLNVLVCFDGALAIPRRKNVGGADGALAHFNRVLCSLLLGGIICEAVDRRDIVWGRLHEKCQLWPVEAGESLNSSRHCHLRQKSASNFDRILLSSPKNVDVSTFRAALAQGARVLELLDTLSPTFFLTGFTELRYHNFANALGNLWICAEQLTESIWKKSVCEPAKSSEVRAKSRMESLKNTGNWSTGMRQELLFQIGVLDHSVYSILIPARKARNELVHYGLPPSPSVVGDLFDGILAMIETITDIDSLGIRQIGHRSSDHSEFIGTEFFEGWKIVSDRLRS